MTGGNYNLFPVMEESDWTYLYIKVKLSKMMIINYLNLTSNIT